MMAHYNRKADLLWEATRRNERYKKEWHDHLNEYKKKYLDSTADIDNSKIEKLPGFEPNKWKIKLFNYDPLRNDCDFFYWLNPEIDYTELHSKNHPYLHIFSDEYFLSNTYFCGNMGVGISAYDKGTFEFEYNEQSGEIYFKQFLEKDEFIYIKKTHLINKALIIVDPFEPDEMIMEKIKIVKNEITEKVKKEIEILKDKEIPTFYPPNIMQYIGWLKKYDKIIEHAQKNPDKYDLIIDHGAVCISPKSGNISYGDFVPASSKKFETDRKYSKTAYEKSVQLIQQTPNILFSPAK